jgi:hypothetical protein
MSLIFATQLTALATLGLAVLAPAAAVVAGLALRKQSRELTILAAENKRQAAERRRAQASSVFIGPPIRGIRMVQASAQNGSSFPVHDAQFWYYGPDGLSGPEDLGMIMPGPVGINGRQMRYEEAVERAILTFRDAEGLRWGASAIHNFPASIFTAPSVATWSDMSANTRKKQVTRLVTLRHRSTRPGALVLRYEVKSLPSPA